MGPTGRSSGAGDQGSTTPNFDASRDPLALRSLRSIGRRLLGLPNWGKWLAPIAWMGLIFLLSEREGEADAGFYAPMAVLLNLGHAPLFGLLALLAVPLLPRVEGWPRLDLRNRVALVGAVLLYGLSDEWHQSRIPHRSASALDLVTDGVGALATVTVIAYVGFGGATGWGLAWRLGVGLLACVAAAAGATFLPRLEGAPGWL